MFSMRGAVTVGVWMLLAGCVALVTPEVPSPSPPGLPPDGLPNGVAAGDVTQESVVLWARAATPGVITFTVQMDAGQTGNEQTGNEANDALATTLLTHTVTEPLLPVTVTVTGLSPGTIYNYQATIANGDHAMGFFRTPAGEGEQRGLRFAASGDVRGDLAPYPAIANAPDRELGFFINLGDTVYADIGSPAVPTRAQTLEEFRLKHAEVNSTRHGLNTLAALRASTISFATIDDHEVLNNFAGGASANNGDLFAEQNGLVNQTQLYGAGLDAFLAYHPIQIERYGSDADVRMAGRPKLYRYRTFGADAAIFVLDTRSFRDAPLPRVTNLDDDETLAQFEQASFDEQRTLLGANQIADLQHDLIDAQQRGITWKFVITSVPIQYLDMTSANDRWQGYAAERTRLLRFIAEEEITNVVFIAADIHGTVVNNLSYQEGMGEAQVPSKAWEIAVGPVAAYPPFGLAMYLTYLELGMLTEADEANYESLPVHHDTDDEPNDRDDYVKGLINEQMARFGYNPIGLADAPSGEAALEVELTQGDYMAGHVYGWTEFDIDATTQALTVTSYGIPAYAASLIEQDAATILAHTPEVVSQFVVQPSQ